MSPAVDKAPIGSARAAAALRVLLGLMWLYNVAWKRAPDFGQEAGNGLFKFTGYAVSDPVFPPFSWVVEHAVLPHFQAFGWVVLVVETGLAVMLLTGTWVRVAAAVGIAQSVAIALSVAYAPAEWPWSYWLMIGAHLMILFSSAGRVLSTDAIRAGLSRGIPVLRSWGVLAMLVGLVAVVGSLDDPLAASGYEVGSSDPSVSLGAYNLGGGLVLLLIGVLLLAASRPGSGAGGRATAMGAAVTATVAALSLYIQVGFSDPVLGGTTTSAGFLLCLAVVALAVTRQTSAATTHSRQQPASPSVAR
ncbi:Rv1678 family membrane protein [Janibacter alittae]|uniref:DoxX family membrane protein n=1 Tax=Janibacter alittae TaxID=3115209 RepID=A0ABZ2MF37_9MICO